MNPRHVWARINQGITERELGKFEQAIENFEVALLFKQLESYLWAEKGRTYHFWGEWNCATDYHRALTQLFNISYVGLNKHNFTLGQSVPNRIFCPESEVVLSMPKSHLDKARYGNPIIGLLWFTNDKELPFLARWAAQS